MDINAHFDETGRFFKEACWYLLPEIKIEYGPLPTHASCILESKPVPLRLYLGLINSHARILQCLYNSDATCTHEQIFNFYNKRPYNGNKPDIDVIRTAICALNRKVEPFGIRIEPVRNVGYFLPREAKKLLIRIITDDLYDALLAQEISGSQALLVSPSRDSIRVSPEKYPRFLLKKQVNAINAHRPLRNKGEFPIGCYLKTFQLHPITSRAPIP